MITNASIQVSYDSDTKNVTLEVICTDENEKAALIARDLINSLRFKGMPIPTEHIKARQQ